MLVRTWSGPAYKIQHAHIYAFSCQSHTPAPACKLIAEMLINTSIFLLKNETKKKRSIPRPINDSVVLCYSDSAGSKIFYIILFISEVETIE